MSSPVSSPANDSAVVDGFLTPRSKVAQLLADIDKKFESASTPTPPRQVDTQTTNKVNLESLRDDVVADETTSIDVPLPSNLATLEESDDDEEDELVNIPRGRAAGRMQTLPASARTLQLQSSSSLTLSRDGQNSSLPGHRNDLPNAVPQVLHEDPDDLYDVTPARPLPVRFSTSPSPVTNVSGGGLFVSPARAERDTDSDEDLPQNPFATAGNKLAELVAQKRAERLAFEAERRQKPGKRATIRSTSSDRSDAPLEDALNSSQEAADHDAERILSDAARPSRKASKKALLEMERETQRMARQQALAHQMKVRKKFTASDLLQRFNFKQAQLERDERIHLATQEEENLSSAPGSDAAELRTDSSEPQSLRREPVSTPPSSPPTPLDRIKAKVEHGALCKMKFVREDTLSSMAGVADELADELPSIDEIMSSARPSNEIGQANVEVHGVQAAPEPSQKIGKLARWGTGFRATLKERPSVDIDDDLEIEAPLPPRLRVFQNTRGVSSGGKAESSALLHLRHLSRLGADTSAKHQHPSARKKGASSINTITSAVALEKILRTRALRQAQQDRAERLAELRSKGIVVLTAEEREKEAEQFENLLEKAREEAEALRKAERSAAKKNVGEGKIFADIGDDESEDDDFELSGSEESEANENDGCDRDGLIDDTADSTDEEEHDEDESENPQEDDVIDTAAHGERANSSQSSIAGQLEEGAALPKVDQTIAAFRTVGSTRRGRKTRVVTDEDDEDEVSQTMTPAPALSDVTSRENDPYAAFNFGPGRFTNLMSPTQAFNATMQTPSQFTQQDSMDIFNRMAPSSSAPRPTVSAHGLLDTQDEDTQATEVVIGSQVPESQRVDLVGQWQTPQTPSASTTIRRDASNLSNMETPGWEPTQDCGLPSPWTNAGINRGNVDILDDVAEDEDHHDTQDTVRLRISESPAPSTQPRQPRGRLSRRQVVSDENEEDADDALIHSTSNLRNAFTELAKRRRKALTDAERVEAEKEMKDMMDEAAEESDDEYAGLGGDDVVAPETAEDREMIDSSQIDVDERALAAHHAERERLQQEAEVSKLYKDLTTGALRRRAAGGLWDVDEDEAELAVRRRQARQREEARKRKLLLQDENLAGLTEGKSSVGKEAFLKAIADDDNDDDVVDLEEEEPDGPEAGVLQSQGTAQTQQSDSHGPLREVSGNKRARDESTDTVDTERAPAKQRRTAHSSTLLRRPTSLLEVRETLSFLLEEPESNAASAASALDFNNDESSEDEFDGPLSQLDREQEADEEVEAEKQRTNDGGFVPDAAARATGSMAPPPRPPASQRRVPAKSAVVDRLSLKRNSSSGSSADSGRGTKSAWASASSGSAFKVPSLLRRATTSAASGANDRGVTIGNPAALARANSAGAASGLMKNTGRKGSSLAAQARADERKAIVDAGARKREADRLKMAEIRRASSGGLNIGRGGFE